MSHKTESFNGGDVQPFRMVNYKFYKFNQLKGLCHHDQSKPVAVCTVYMEKPSKCTDAGPQGVSIYGERESMRAVTG